MGSSTRSGGTTCCSFHPHITDSESVHRVAILHRKARAEVNLGSAQFALGYTTYRHSRTASVSSPPPPPVPSTTMSDLDSKLEQDQRGSYADRKRGGYDSPPAAPIDKAAERKLVRKMDYWIMPIFFYLYMLCFLDRTNIGNARVAGLERDLGLTGYMYNISLSIFYICYALIEVPSNLVLRKVGASIWIPTIIVSFGLVSFCTTFVDNFGELLVVRVMLGITEGGLMPAYMLVLSRFYTKRELVFRIAFFASSATMAGMFGGLLAYGFLQTNVNFARGWRAIFAWEGVITMGSGLLAFFAIPNAPGTAKFLNEDEKALAEQRIRRESAGVKVMIEATKARLVIRSFKNANTFACALGFGLSSLSLQGLSLFIPTIIRGIDPTFSTLEIQLKTVPVYAVAFVLALSFAYASSYYDRRAYVIVACNVFALAGYATFLATPTSATNARYAAVFLCAMGIYTPGPIWLAWGAGNAGLDQMRAVASALVVGLGTMGSVVATWSYLPFDAPRYTIGNALNVSVVAASQILAVLLMLYNKRENALRDRGGRDYRLENKTEQEINELGNSHPEFRYVY